MTRRGSHRSGGATQKPNILLLVADDQGPWALGASGNEEIRTPCLDALAARGARFLNFYATSPVCSPARASILTGEMPGRHGVQDWVLPRRPGAPPERYLARQETFVHHLARAGYRTGLFGKWHLGEVSKPQSGFERWLALEESHGPYLDATFVSDRPGDECRGYVTDVIARYAAQFACDSDSRPFFASVNFTAPHHPWVGQHPQRFLDLYEDCAFRSCPQGERSQQLHQSLAPAVRKALADPRPSLIGYFAAVTAMDTAIRLMLDMLERAGRRERTAVIFTSDNGYSCGHGGIWGKGNATWPLNLSENSVKVPLIVDWPEAFEAGHVCPLPASAYDIWPTLLALADIEHDGRDKPGQDLAHHVRQCTGAGPRPVSVYDEYGAARMMRKGRYKLVLRWPDGPHELHDLELDPEERRNRWRDPRHAALRADLERELVTWFARYADAPWDARRTGITGTGQGAPLSSRDRFGDLAVDDARP